jgi:hypothetical protein
MMMKNVMMETSFLVMDAPLDSRLKQDSLANSQSAGVYVFSAILLVTLVMIQHLMHANHVQTGRGRSKLRAGAA